MKYLAENERYKLYAMDENLYLKDKRKSKINEYDKIDKYIDTFYGEPECGLISVNNEYIIAGGEHLSIYFIEKEKMISIEDLWTVSIFQLDFQLSTYPYLVHLIVGDNSEKFKHCELDVQTLKMYCYKCSNDDV